MSAMTLLAGPLYAHLPAAFDRLQIGESVALGPDGVEAPPCGPPQEASLGVYSSGSTGSPKMVWRPWAEIERNLSKPVPGRVWGTPFLPWSFAGAQVAAQAWRDGGAVLGLSGEVRRDAALIGEEGVTALSCTPTYARLLLLDAQAETAWKLRHVTLGGEPLPPGLARHLVDRFQVRFSAVYASAEFGLLLKTRRVDGFYETAELSKRREWKVGDGGELLVKAGGVFKPTGDLVEVEGDLMRVIGRVGDVVNVGGVKISLAEVRAQAEVVAGVVEAEASAVPNPVTGQVVKLRYSVAPAQEEPLVLDRLQRHLRAVLPKAAWPRVWEMAPPTLGRNAKKTRS